MSRGKFINSGWRSNRPETERRDHDHGPSPETVLGPELQARVNKVTDLIRDESIDVRKLMTDAMTFIVFKGLDEEFINYVRGTK